LCTLGGFVHGAGGGAGKNKNVTDESNGRLMDC
jgi:hypothetical protein